MHDATSVLPALSSSDPIQAQRHSRSPLVSLVYSQQRAAAQSHQPLPGKRSCAWHQPFGATELRVHDVSPARCSPPLQRQPALVVTQRGSLASPSEPVPEVVLEHAIAIAAETTAAARCVKRVAKVVVIAAGRAETVPSARARKVPKSWGAHRVSDDRSSSA